MWESFIGLVLGERYEIQQLLGSGGMAWVFEAHDRALDRQVAVKIVIPALILSAKVPDIADRFIKEAHIAASLQHTRILKVYDQGKQLVEGQPLVYLVMQLAHGGTLAERIAEKSTLTPYEAGSILDQVCAALDYAHNRRVIHLDLKPANILLDEGGNALVADFGLARLFHTATQVTTRTFAGTPPYMPLEQLLGKHAGRLSDVYALGITLYQALTGELPERKFTEEGLLVHLRQPLPHGIRAVIERATQSDSSGRYHTAGDLARAFTAAIATLEPVPPEQNMEVGKGQPDLSPREETSVSGETEETPPTPRIPLPKKSWISRVGFGLAALVIVAILAVSGRRWWDEQVKGVLVALSLTLTTSPTEAAAPTATPSPPTPTPTVALTPTASPTPHLIVPTERLPVYAGPGEHYGVVGEVHRGDRLPLYGRSADGMWWQVDYLGRKCWIRAQPVGANIDPDLLPTREVPPTPARTPTPTAEVTSSPEPNTMLRLQNPGFEGIRENSIFGWRWSAEDNFLDDTEYDPGKSLDTPLFRQADDPAGMIDGPTLQIDAAAYLKYKIHIFQTVSAPPAVTVRFQALAKVYSDVDGVKLAAGIDPDGGRDCSQARWGEVQIVNHSSGAHSDGAVQLIAPDVEVGDAGQVTVCLYAETLYAAYRNTTFFDSAMLIANPE